MKADASTTAVRNRMEIPLFRPGKEGPQLSSAEDMNVIVRAVRSLVNPMVSIGLEPKAELSDSNFRIQVPATTAAASSDTRLFNFNNSTRIPFGSTGSFVGDLGALATGWTGDVEAKIVAALSGGKRIKTTLTFLCSVAKIVPADVSNLVLDIHIYSGDASYGLAVTVTMPEDAESADYLMTFQGELSQAISGGSATYTEAAAFTASQYTGAPISTPKFFAGVLTNGHANGAVSNVADGKITGAAESASNCTFGLSLQNLTVDVLPSLSA
jgi:hypothetical protein